jgi:hypothetical protein
MAPVAQETVKQTLTAASVVNHIKNNRIEYLLCVGIAHLLGLTNTAYGYVNGVCL